MNLPDPKTMNFAQIVEMLGRVDLDIATLQAFQQALRLQGVQLAAQAAAPVAPQTEAPLIQQAAPVSNDEIDWEAVQSAQR